MSSRPTTSQMSDRFAVDPPYQQPHSTTAPLTSGGISRSFEAMARCAL